MATKGRAIKIPVEGEITEVEVDFVFPDLNRELFGADHMLIEIVRPIGLFPWNDGRTFSQGVLVMLVDEEGLFHQRARNARAGYLYGTHHHGQYIYGDAYIVAEQTIWIDDEDGSYQDLELAPIPDEANIEAINDLITAAAIS